MNFPRIFAALLALAGIAPLAGCAKLNHAAAEVGRASRDSIAKVGNLFPARVPVVEVREKDLKEMPLGHERALAFEKKRQRNFWFFTGPVDFREPDLPDSDLGLDAGLLPPKEP